MAIITISRGSYSKGKEIAEKTAEKLGYQCIAREVLLEASKEFNIPEIMLRGAIHDAPSILERFTYGREKYISFVQAAFLRCVRRDNVVYDGLAGQFFLRGISHAVKVRIIADMDRKMATLRVTPAMHTNDWRLWAQKYRMEMCQRMGWSVVRGQRSEVRGQRSGSTSGALLLTSDR
mgnify:CR=1 FL=1